MIACGTTLQAIVGAYFFKKATNEINPLQNTYCTFIFIISCLASCLIAATVGTTTLVALDYIPFSNYWITWITWWLGDSTGAITIAPTLIMMTLISTSDFNLNKFFEFIALITALIVFGFWRNTEVVIKNCLLMKWLIYVIEKQKNKKQKMKKCMYKVMKK